MRLWIDAAASSDLYVFGMSLIERHIRAAVRLGRGIGDICVDVGAGNLPELPADLMRRHGIQIRRAPGLASGRLEAFLRESKERVMAVSAQTVVDQRLFEFAANHESGFAAFDGTAAALAIDPLQIASSLPEAGSLEELARSLAASGTVRSLEQSDFPSYIRRLRRNLPFWLLPVCDDADRQRAERFMFRASYKGSTDFFTRYVYPFMVWRLVRPLARLRVHPNWVSGFNILLGIAAVPAFAFGEYAIGFACAFVMSILDSVDGKLARLTFTDSQLGTRLDHLLDLIHPPFWYLAWAWAIANGDIGAPVMSAAVLLVIVYILDRLCVKIYTASFHRALYAHTRFDGFVRTFIARRNINLPLFLVGVVSGFALEAFLLIVAWQLLTLVWHVCRIAWILMFQAGVSENSRAPA